MTEKGQLFFATKRNGKYVIAYFPVAAMTKSSVDDLGNGEAVFHLEQLPPGESMPVPEDAFWQFVEDGKAHNNSSDITDHPAGVVVD